MKISITKTKIMGAPLEGVNPLPKFRNHATLKQNISETFPEKLKKDFGATVKVLPYLLQDRYSRKRIPMEIKACVLENDYLRAEFWPEYGGRLYSLYDKVNNCELLMKNPVFQPANLAIRNAWLSGGIEWNIGSLGHTYTTCDNVYTAILKDENGNDFLRIYEFERCTRVFWQIDFHLPDDSKHLISHVKIVNPFDEITTTYWWTNTAVVDTGKTRITASTENIILVMNGELDYTKLPYTDAIPNADMSYPSNVTRSFEYFFQPDDDVKDAWEAATYEDGITFYEKSTAPLIYRKLFCWGNHRSGTHWQEYLSDKGSGYYAEIQAGFARSQLHDKLLKPKGVLEWTQCFGGAFLDKDKIHGVSYKDASDYCNESINKRLDFNLLTSYDEKCRKLADMPVSESSLIHFGSGFGTLEIMRMEKYNDGDIPKNLCFPKSSLGDTEKVWLNLLENKILENKSPDEIPTSYMTSRKWISLMENSLSEKDGKNWFNMLNLGVSYYELTDTEKIAADAEKWEKRDEYIKKAKEAWLSSIELCPSVWAYRNLAIWEIQNGSNEKAEEYYEKAINLKIIDFSVVAEYLVVLAKAKKYEKAWELYEKLPLHMQKEDRIMIAAAFSAVKLKKTEFLKEFFSYDHYAVAEGENSLTDIWFEYCATCMAIERGMKNVSDEDMEKLIDEAWDNCPPPENIDFRMSVDKKNKYRLES